MKLDAIFNQARSLDIAQRNSENFNLSQATTGFEDNSSLNATTDLPNMGRSLEQEKQEICNCTAATQSCKYENSTGINLWKKCSRCGSWEQHPASKCPAKRSKCFKCGYFGHYAKECCSRSRATDNSAPSGGISVLMNSTLNACTSQRLNISVTVMECAPMPSSTPAPV